MQAGAPQDVIADELVREATFDFAVHQAAGMVSVQASMSVGDALVALRAHAFTTDRTSSELALRVVARDLRFDPETREWREG
jgi:acyl-CoA hydrolase